MFYKKIISNKIVMMTVRNKTGLIAGHCSKILTWNVSPNSPDNQPYHVLEVAARTSGVVQE